MEKPSYCIDIPADEYHQATKDNKFTSSHRLNLFRKCPALYIKHVTGEIVEGDTEAFLLGRATHTHVLEGQDKFYIDYTVASGPVNPKTGEPFGRMTKAYKEWAAAQEKPIVNAEDFKTIAKMSEAVRGHIKALDLLRAGFAEATIRTKFGEEPVQVRLDWYDPERNIIVDLKTCNDVDRFAFDIRDYGYPHQLAFYAEAVRLASCAETGKNPKHPANLPECWIIAVEKREPFRVAVYNISEATLDDLIYAQATKFGTGLYPTLAELAECRVTDTWPTRYENFGVI